MNPAPLTVTQGTGKANQSPFPESVDWCGMDTKFRWEENKLASHRSCCLQFQYLGN